MSYMLGFCRRKQLRQRKGMGSRVQDIPKKGGNCRLQGCSQSLPATAPTQVHVARLLHADWGHFCMYSVQPYQMNTTLAR
jgi:hypothetical protein